MKLAVVDNVNGTFKVESEWNVPDAPSAQGAIVAFHSRCTVLWNASDVERATVKILDEDLNLFGDYEETVVHNQEPEEE